MFHNLHIFCINEILHDKILKRGWEELETGSLDNNFGGCFCDKEQRNIVEVGLRKGVLKIE